MSLLEQQISRISHFLSAHIHTIGIIEPKNKIRYICSRLHISKRMLEFYLSYLPYYQGLILNSNNGVARKSLINQLLTCNKFVFNQSLVARKYNQNQGFICNKNRQNNGVARNSLSDKELCATKNSLNFYKEKCTKETSSYILSRYKRKEKNINTKREKKKNCFVKHYKQKMEEITMGSQSNQPKRQYADCVFLTDAEYNKLIERFDPEIVDIAIEKVSNYKMTKGKKYKSDYHAILQWGIQAALEQQNRLLRAGITLSPATQRSSPQRKVAKPMSESKKQEIYRSQFTDHSSAEEIASIKQKVEEWKRGELSANRGSGHNLVDKAQAKSVIGTIVSQLTQKFTECKNG